MASPLLQPHPKKNQQPFHTFLKLNSCMPRAGSKTQVILPSLLKGLHTCPFVCSSSHLWELGNMDRIPVSYLSEVKPRGVT